MREFLLLAVSACALVLPALGADISGSWSITGDVVGNPVNMKCAFMQDGTKISGTCSGGEAGSIKSTGSVTDNKVTFQHSAQGYDLTYTATLDAAGTSMQGEIAVAGVTGTFSATKDVAAAPKSAVSDIAGSWTITGDVVGNAINMKCDLKRDGDKISGSCAYEGLGVSPTTGSMAGNKVTLQNSVQREQQYDLTYNGTLDDAGASIKGDIAVAGVSGNFTGTRDK